MKRCLILSLGLVLLLSGCAPQVINPVVDPTPVSNSESLNLKGTWNYWMRHEIGSENSLVRGTMIFQEEFCDESICQLAGLILKPQLATTGTRLPFSGIAIPERRIIRIQYFDQNTSSDLLVVIVEFDIFLENYDPERTLIGHFSIFDQTDSGPLNEDSPMLLASLRGRLTMAGRVTAWPMNIVDPRLR